MKFSQKTIHYLTRFLPEALLVVSMVLGFSLFMMTLIVRSQQLPNAAKWLPAQQTRAFVMADRNLYNLESEFLGTPINELSWLKNHYGLALINRETARFFQIKSQPEARQYMQSLLLEEESLIFEGDTYCYPSTFPECFVFVDDFIVLSPSKSALQSIQSVEKGKTASLKSSSRYQNIRSRLPYFSEAFVYIDLEKSRKMLAQWAGERAIYEPGYMESLLQLFPAYGLTIQQKTDHLYGESMLAIDKSVIGGEGFFRHNSKQNYKLIENATGDYTYVFSGHDLEAQLKRTEQVMQQLNQSAALVLRSSLQNFFEEQVGGELPDYDFERILSLFGGEYLFAWTPGQAFELQLEIESQEDAAQLKWIKEYWRSHKESDWILEQNDSLLTLSSAQNEQNSDQQKFSLKDDYKLVLPGSDELSAFQVTIGGENAKIGMTNKYFDDGIFSRYLITLQ